MLSTGILPVVGRRLSSPADRMMSPAPRATKAPPSSTFTLIALAGVPTPAVLPLSSTSRLPCNRPASGCDSRPSTRRRVRLFDSTSLRLSAVRVPIRTSPSVESAPNVPRGRSASSNRVNSRFTSSRCATKTLPATVRISPTSALLRTLRSAALSASSTGLRMRMSSSARPMELREVIVMSPAAKRLGSSMRVWVVPLRRTSSALIERSRLPRVRARPSIKAACWLADRAGR